MAISSIKTNYEPFQCSKTVANNFVRPKVWVYPPPHSVRRGTLRACPPTCLYAPNVYAHSYARSVPCKRLVSVPPWVGPHPQRTPPPGTPPPPPRDPPTPPQPPLSPSGRLFRVDGYSKWMAFPSAWLFRGVLLQLNTRTCSDSVNAESIDCFGGVIVPSVQSQRGAACKDLTQEHPKSSPGAPRSTPRASSST